MNCKNCGAELKENQKFCPKCGAPVVEKQRSEKSADYPIKATNVSAKKVKSKKKLKAVIACFCCLAVIITGTVGGLYWHFSFDNEIREADKNYVYFDSCFSDAKITDVNSALEVISDVKDALGINDVHKELKVQSVNTVDDNTYYRFQQYYNDILVYGRDIIVAADENGTALALTGNSVKIEDIQEYDLSKIDKNNTVVYGLNPSKICTISYENREDGDYLVFTDIKTGDVVDRLCKTYTASERNYPQQETDGTYSLFDSKRNIRILNSNGKQLEKTDFLSVEDDKYQRIFYTGENKDKRQNIFSDHWDKYEVEYIVNDNISVVQANTADGFDSSATQLMDNVALTYDFYLEKLGRNGFDDNNGLIFASYNDNYDNGNNAYASGGSLLSFGKKRDLSIDLIAHEYTHSVEFMISHMTYKGQSGAIMEGYSDIFGEIVQDYSDGEMNNNCDWVNKYRNIKEPLKTQNPEVYERENWETTTDKLDKNGKSKNDHGHVHNNSTVISHAAYLMWNGHGDGDNFKIDTEKLAKLWYRSLYFLCSDATFNQCANSVMLVAKSMQDTGELTAAQVACVRRSFEAVGIYPDNYLSKSATNSAVVHVKDIKNNNLPSYYLKVTDNKSNVIIDNEFTDTNPYVVNVPDNGIYTFSVKQSKDSAVEYVTKVRVLNINRENSELNLQTGLDLENINTDSRTEKEGTSKKDTINLLEGFWENDIQCPCLYKFFEDGTVDEYYIDPLNRDKPEKISYSCTLKYQWDGKSLVINWGDNGLGEVYTTTLEPITNSAPIEWNGDFSYLPNDEIFFYETSWVDSGEPSDNAMYLVKSKWREADVSIPESNEKSAVSSQQLTISESESNKPNINTPNEPIKWLFDSKNGTLTITGTGKVTANWGGINKESVQKVVLDDRVTEIDSWIFSGCSNITDIKLPSRLKKIGNHAFKDCTNLKHVNYPEGLVEIETEAFWGCSSLEGIILPNSLKTLGDRVFADCSSAKRITIGKGLTSIPFSTFSGNTSVEFIEIPNGVRTLGSYAFARCTSLKKVIIGDGVTTIESWAFSECISLTEIHIGSNVKELSDFGVFKNCKSLTNIVLPEGLTTIGQQSFKGCTSLKSITIPKSVTKIDAYYIDGCNALTDIYYKGTPSEWNAIQKIGDYGNTESVLKHVTIHYNY